MRGVHRAHRRSTGSLLQRSGLDCDRQGRDHHRRLVAGWDTSRTARLDLLSTAAAPTGALAVGFWLPQPAPAQIINPPGAAWATSPAVDEVNAWVVVAPDDTVTIRIAQTELGQGVWTSNAMMVCEELQCDWTKVRPQYASANRDAREKAPAWTLNVMGKGATDPTGRGDPGSANRARTGVTGRPNT